MKLRALALLVLLLASSLAVLPTAAAADGDLLATPGNPCNVQGRAGGVAVDETAKRLYYTVRDRKEIYNASTISPFGCAAAIVPSVSVAGWDHLAFDKSHATIRFWAASGATLHGLTRLGAGVVAHTFPQAITAIEVNEATGRVLVQLQGETSLRVHTAALVEVGTIPLSVGDGLASWQDGLLASDASSYVRLFSPTGAWSGFGFRPGATWRDEFFQPYRSTYDHRETAFDESTYAASQKGALYLMQETVSVVCVASCPPPPVYECVRYEGSVCLEQRCIANCSPSGGVYETRYFPRILVVEVKRPCPTGPVWQPCGDPPCQNVPPVVASFARPGPGVQVRGAPHAASGVIVAVGAPLVVEVTDPTGNAGKTLRLTHPGGTETSFGAPLVASLDTTAWPRGSHTLVATVTDEEECDTDTATLPVWVESPTMRTRAQNLRVEGNLPLNVVAGTLALEPADKLLGHETFALDETSAGALRWSAVTADAQHFVESGAFTASASTRVAFADGHLDLRQLCADLTSRPECAALPILRADAEADALPSWASVTAAYFAGTTSASAGTDGVTVVDATQASGARQHAVTTLDADSVATRGDAAGRPVQRQVLLPQTQVLNAGPVTVVLNEVVERRGALFAETTASIARILVDDGTLKGEIVIGESYAGVSLGAASLLQGPPDLVATQDDFALGVDAPAAPAAAPLLAPGAYAGLLLGADRADAFRVHAAPGEKLRVDLTPGDRVGVYAAPLPTPPATEGAARLLRVELYDPSGALRDASTVATDATPGFVELNVDQAGAWQLVVRRMDALDGRAPYAVLATTSVAPLPPDEGAGATCAAAPALDASGAMLGALGAGQTQDVLRFTQAASRPVVIAATPLELEGMDVALHVLDASCNVVASASTGGPAKGAPETLALPLAPGTWFVSVERLNGIGGYALSVQAR